QRVHRGRSVPADRDHRGLSATPSTGAAPAAVGAAPVSCQPSPRRKAGPPAGTLESSVRGDSRCGQSWLRGRSMSRVVKLAVIPGDGIGPEVIEQAERVLDAATANSEVVFEKTRFAL